MAKSPTSQAPVAKTGGTKLQTVKFAAGAFHAALLPIIGSDKVGWYNNDHEKLVDSLLPDLHSEAGEAVDLEDQLDIIKLILCPTEDLQRKVLNQAFTEAGYVLDEGAEAALGLLLNVVQFGDYLAKSNNPKTGEPYITKAKKGGKKKTFDALLSEEVAAE